MHGWRANSEGPLEIRKTTFTRYYRDLGHMLLHRFQLSSNIRFNVFVFVRSILEREYCGRVKCSSVYVLQRKENKILELDLRT